MESMADASTVERMLLNQARRKNIPMNGSIELLPLCNMDCKMCYVRLSREEMEAQGRLRTVEEWLSVAQQMKTAGVLFLLLTGGEPLIYPGFKELYLELKKMGMILTINTNGTLLDEEWADFFAANKPRRINITLYGTNDEMYRELCRRPKGFEEVVSAVKLLRERNVDVKISGSAARANEGQIEDIIRIGHELGVPVVVDTYMMPAVRERSMPYDMQARLDPEAAAAVRIRALQLEMTEETFDAYRNQLIAQIENFEAGEPVAEPIGCMAASCSFSVNWKGNLQPCVIVDSPAVNVFETDFQKAWNDVVEQAKVLKTNPECSVCRYRPLCRVCVGSGITEVGSCDAIPEYMCRYAKESYRLLKQIEKD